MRRCQVHSLAVDANVKGHSVAPFLGPGCLVTVGFLIINPQQIFVPLHGILSKGVQERAKRTIMKPSFSPFGFGYAHLASKAFNVIQNPVEVQIVNGEQQLNQDRKCLRWNACGMCA